MTVICISMTSSDISPFACIIYYNARIVVEVQRNEEDIIQKKFISEILLKIIFLIINDSKNNN